mmetsp:Transcript_92682/g.215380  ORF Transcript_92682/g.215380 Transcript_92682/m.215380 type:complete len:311 (-) Transcript_92682:1435-2367(-)
MPHDVPEGQDGLASFGKALGGEKAPPKSNESVTAPVSHEAGGEVRQASSKRWHTVPALLLCASPVEGCTARGTPELRRGERQAANQPPRRAMPPDKVTRAFQHDVSSRGTQCGDDHVEVEGHEQARELRDEPPCLPEPVHGGLETWHIHEPSYGVVQQPITLADVVHNWGARGIRVPTAHVVESTANTQQATIHKGTVAWDIISAPRPSRPIQLFALTGEEQVAQLAQRQPIEATTYGLDGQEPLHFPAEDQLRAGVDAEHEYASWRKARELQAGAAMTIPHVRHFRDVAVDLKITLHTIKGVAIPVAVV